MSFLLQRVFNFSSLCNLSHDIRFIHRDTFCAQLSIFSSTRRTADSILPRLLPARVTRSIRYNDGVTLEQASSRDSCKSASAFRLCNYRAAKLIRRRRSQFVSRRRRSCSQRAPLSSRSRVARKHERTCRLQPNRVPRDSRATVIIPYNLHGRLGNCMPLCMPLENRRPRDARGNE